MKKYIILFLTLFMVNFQNVKAVTDERSATLTCNYENNGDIISIVYKNIGTLTLGETQITYRVDYIKDNVRYCFSKDNNCPNTTEVSSKYVNIRNFDTIVTNPANRSQYFYNINYRFQRETYQEEANFDADKLCSKSIFVKDEEDSQDIVLCETNDTKTKDTACAYSYGDSNYKEYTFKSTALGINKDSGTTIDYGESYAQNKEKVSMYCNSSYDEELCEKAKADLDAVVQASQDSGKSQSGLEEDYKEFYTNVDIPFGEANCDTLLGRIDDSNAPAYYLNFAFNLIKYIAIVALVVLTIIDYVKAAVASNPDDIKKVNIKTIKRAIILVIIFFLPMIINFILDILGIVSTDPTCGIGNK